MDPVPDLGVEAAQQHYDSDGFCVVPGLLDPAELPDAWAVMDRIIMGDYVTGVAPSHVDPNDDPANQLQRVNQPQIADPAVTELLLRSRIGEAAAALTGADMVQAWAVQLIRKPSTTAHTANVGWHQDDDYWHRWWEGEVFTCWLALTDVTADAGPVRFVRGSHRWGYLGGGNFFAQDLEGSPTRDRVPEGEVWEEREAVVPPGGASFHHKHTIHGSGPNRSGQFRRSYAVHLRTEKSAMLPTVKPEIAERIEDPIVSPILFGG